MRLAAAETKGFALPDFTSDEIQIAYEVHGEGAPILLIHGFASNGQVNWVDTGWVETLTDAGFQAITIDNRGHGSSEKLYDPAAYPARIMAQDAANLIDHLGIGPLPVMGYSMGARISAFLALDRPELVSAVIFGGLGINMVRGFQNSEVIVAGLLAPALEDVGDPTGRMFRRFADSTGSDRKALAACMQSSRDPITEDDIGRIDVPALVAVGSADDVGGDPEALAALLPRGEAYVIERRDHMRATGDKMFKQAALDFLDGLTS